MNFGDAAALSELNEYCRQETETAEHNARLRRANAIETLARLRRSAALRDHRRRLRYYRRHYRHYNSPQLNRAKIILWNSHLPTDYQFSKGTNTCFGQVLPVSVWHDAVKAGRELREHFETGKTRNITKKYFEQYTTIEHRRCNKHDGVCTHPVHCRAHEKGHQHPEVNEPCNSHTYCIPNHINYDLWL
jgi:hypothetical protein